MLIINGWDCAGSSVVVKVGRSNGMKGVWYSVKWGVRRLNAGC